MNNYMFETQAVLKGKRQIKGKKDVTKTYNIFTFTIGSSYFDVFVSDEQYQNENETPKNQLGNLKFDLSTGRTGQIYMNFVDFTY